MIGTRATGRTKTYRYYTCFNLARYDATKCDFTRLNADAVDTAVLDALAGFYRDQYPDHRRPTPTPRSTRQPPRRTSHRRRGTD
jgi:hypothetical protein